MLDLVGAWAAEWEKADRELNKGISSRSGGLAAPARMGRAEQALLSLDTPAAPMPSKP